MNNHLVSSKTFLTISTYLTGYNEVELLGTGMLETYFNVFLEKFSPETLDYFFTEVDEILLESADDEDKINAAIAARLIPDSAYDGIAKNIILVWYTGNWGSDVISSQSYQQGLMWDAAEAHPPGAKQPGYGSWANLPIRIPTK
jgi:hypothetical protein